MALMGVQLLGYILSIAGLCGLILATFTNEWKVLGHDNDNTVFLDINEGLWMKCNVDSSSRVCCVSYTSILYQSVEIQVGRVMMIISIVLSSVGVLVAVAGLRCTRCLDGEERLKDKVSLIGGSLFILSGLCSLAITCWFMNEIVAEFYQKEPQEDRHVVGRSLIAGFVAALLCLFGGVLLSICSVTHMRSGSNVSKPLKTKSPGKEYV